MFLSTISSLSFAYNKHFSLDSEACVQNPVHPRKKARPTMLATKRSATVTGVSAHGQVMKWEKKSTLALKPKAHVASSLK